MNPLVPAFAALLLLSAPALANSMIFDLPRLSFPDDSAPVSQGCLDQTAPGTATGCKAGQ